MKPSIDNTIDQVERLYETVTGGPAPTTKKPYAPIPPEVDPQRYIEENMAQLASALAREGQPAGPSVPRWTPAVTTRRSGNDVVVQIDVPGVQRDWIDITLDRNLLTITGVRPVPWEADVGRTELGNCETRFGPFQRTVVLPEAVPAKDLKAKLSDGVLELRYARADGVSAKTTVPIA